MLRRLSVEEAAALLRGGGVVAFPTETSYGLGCRAMDACAVARLVAAKGRAEGHPLPLLLPSIEALPPTPLRSLAEAWWPGPLTIVVVAPPELPRAITGGRGTVGVRISSHPIAGALARAVGEAIVATSANPSGAPAPVDAAGCDALPAALLDGVVDGGRVPGGASTVVGVAVLGVAGVGDAGLIVHRAGVIDPAELEAWWRAARQRLSSSAR